MIRSLLGLLGRFTLALASMAFLTAVGLLVVGSWLATWPILRLSPRERRIRATVDMASAGIALLSSFASRTEQGSDEARLARASESPDLAPDDGLGP